MSEEHELTFVNLLEHAKLPFNEIQTILKYSFIFADQHYSNILQANVGANQIFKHFKVRNILPFNPLINNYSHAINTNLHQDATKQYTNSLPSLLAEDAEEYATEEQQFSQTDDSKDGWNDSNWGDFNDQISPEQIPPAVQNSASNSTNSAASTPKLSREAVNTAVNRKICLFVSTAIDAQVYEAITRLIQLYNPAMLHLFSPHKPTVKIGHKIINFHSFPLNFQLILSNSFLLRNATDNSAFAEEIALFCKHLNVKPDIFSLGKELKTVGTLLSNALKQLYSANNAGNQTKASLLLLERDLDLCSVVGHSADDFFRVSSLDDINNNPHDIHFSTNNKEQTAILLSILCDSSKITHKLIKKTLITILTAEKLNFQRGTVHRSEISEISHYFGLIKQELGGVLLLKHYSTLKLIEIYLQFAENEIPHSSYAKLNSIEKLWEITLKNNENNPVQELIQQIIELLAEIMQNSANSIELDAVLQLIIYFYSLIGVRKVEATAENQLFSLLLSLDSTISLDSSRRKLNSIKLLRSTQCIARDLTDLASETLSFSHSQQNLEGNQRASFVLRLLLRLFDENLLVEELEAQFPFTTTGSSPTSLGNSIFSSVTGLVKQNLGKLGIKSEENYAEIKQKFQENHVVIVIVRGGISWQEIKQVQEFCGQQGSKIALIGSTSLAQPGDFVQQIFYNTNNSSSDSKK
jgi:hypothetical protein